VMQGKSNLAIGNFEEALSTYQTKGDQAGVRTSYYNLGNAYYMQSIYNKAIESFRKALKLSEELKDREEMGNAAVGLALVYRQLKQEKEALAYYLEAIADYEASP